MNDLIMYLSNDRDTWRHVKAIPTNATHLLHHGHIPTNLPLAPLHTSIQAPITKHQLVACALPRMTWQVHSASHKPLNLVTTVRSPKGFPDVDRYTHLNTYDHLSINLHLYMHQYMYLHQQYVSIPITIPTAIRKRSRSSAIFWEISQRFRISNSLPTPKAMTGSMSRHVGKELQLYVV